MWLSTVKETSGTDFVVDWQPFSLSQANSKEGEDFKVWEQPGVLDGTDNTLLAHRAGLAAKRQGKEAFESFFITLLKARHEGKKDLTDPEVMREAAVAAGLDVAQFLEDQADPDLLRELAESHTIAVEEHGVFGVPTYVFPGGNAAFLKMFIPPEEQSAEIFESMSKVIGQYEHVGEMKRPQPPWPHDVLRG